MVNRVMARKGKSMKQVSAFTLPLSLLLIGLLALNVTKIYQAQNANIASLRALSEKPEFLEQRQQIISQSLTLKEMENGDYKRQTLSLDGLYNLSHLVTTGALGTRSINTRQIGILQKILAECDVSPAWGETFADAIVKMREYNPNLGIIDFLTALSIPSEDQLKLLSCVRITNPLRKINLRYVTPNVLAILLDVSAQSARQIVQKISSEELTSIKDLRIHLEQQYARTLPRDIITILTIRTNMDHAGIFWTHKGMTFAYVDIARADDLAWEVNWYKILWIPKDLA